MSSNCPLTVCVFVDTLQMLPVDVLSINLFNVIRDLIMHTQLAHIECTLPGLDEYQQLRVVLIRWGTSEIK